MPLDKRELSYLWDMQNAAKELGDIMRGVRFAEFEQDKVMRYAAERLLLMIGEAANHVSPQFRHKHSAPNVTLSAACGAKSLRLAMEEILRSAARKNLLAAKAVDAHPVPC